MCGGGEIGKHTELKILTASSSNLDYRTKDLKLLKFILSPTIFVKKIMICTACQNEKSIDNFSWKIKSKNIRHSRCKECVSLKVKKHYSNNKTKYLIKASKNNKTYKQRNKNFIRKYLIGKCCIDCGNNNPIVLEFDHVIGIKKYNVSRMGAGASSLKAIISEIKKCEIRCANCHRIVTHNRRANLSGIGTVC